MFQRVALLPPAAASVVPSGEKARQVIGTGSLFRVAVTRRAVMFQRVMTPSSPPVARVLPSGANAACRALAAPSNAATSRLVATSHSLTVLSVQIAKIL